MSIHNKLFGTSAYPTFPKNVSIEVTSDCNLACSMCGRTYNERFIERNNVGYMDVNLCKKIIDEASKYRVPINLYRTGEPLLSPYLTEMIEYAKEKGIPWVSISTNGLLMNQEKSRKIIKSGLNDICFSVDAVTDETYIKLRVKGKFSTLMRNIDNFLKIREELNSETPYIRMQLVPMDDNIHEAVPFAKLWAGKLKKQDTVIFHQYCPSNIPVYKGISIKEREELIESLKKEFSGKDMNCQIIVEDFRPPKRFVPCERPWLVSLINWDGAVDVCCRVLGGMKIDTLTDNSLSEMFQSKKYKFLYKTRKKKDIARECEKCEERHFLNSILEIESNIGVLRNPFAIQDGVYGKTEQMI